MSKRALISGITGQDGSYLAELLLAKGYEVHGLIRRSSSFNTGRIEHLYQDPHEQGRLHLHYADMLDPASLHSVLAKTRPDEIYNLAAQSHVRVSFDQPAYTAQVNAVGVVNLLEAIRSLALSARIYQASTSELFGNAPAPQNEQTPFAPRSPYAAAKLHAYWSIVNCREAYGMHASNGILFNHESPRRGETFVTRKITRAATRISLGLQQYLYLGNLEARRDWGFAGDYMDAAWMMLQHPTPGDYVIATGVSHSVREFLELAFAEVGLDWRPHVEIDESYLRPTEVDELRGDAAKAREVLGWRPKVALPLLVRMMVGSDLQLAREEKAAEQARAAHA